MFARMNALGWRTAGAVLGILLLAILAAAFHVQSATRGAVPQATALAPEELEAFFTDPGAQDATRHRGGPDTALAAAMNSARHSIDVAVYHLNLWSIRDALISAHRRGVQVRVVTESDNILGPEIDEIERAGIPVVGDRRETLMHDKFVIIDRQEVWTGSMNLTVGSVYDDNNNLIRLRSVPVAQEFTRQFEEMFVEERFGPLSISDAASGRLPVGATSVEVLFAPEDRVAARLIDLIHEASSSIDFLAYSFTADGLADAMLERAQAGVKLRGVFETDMADALGSELSRFRKAGADVRVDGNWGLMHHKVLVIDGRTVVTGSYNFTRSAEEGNDETVVILTEPNIALEFQQEFERMYAEAGG